VGLFKKGFGGRAVTWAGTWDVVADRTLYRMRAALDGGRGVLRDLARPLSGLVRGAGR
jgi:hypothetical protein